MHQSLLEASRTQKNDILTMLSSIYEFKSLESVSLGSTIPYRGFMVEALESSNSSITKLADMNHIQDTTGQVFSGNKQECRLDHLCAQPASLFEASQNFRPHIYTNRNIIPKLVITGFHEESSSISASTNCYRVLYFQPPSRWVHFNVSLEIPRSSMYWVTARVSRREKARLGLVIPFCVAVSLLAKLQTALEKLGNIEENSRIRLWLSDDDTRELDVLGTAQPAKSSEATERAILTNLCHLGCPRYSEDEVIQLALLELPDRFVSCFEGKLVEEVKSLHHPPISDFVYNIQLLHCLGDVPGIVRLAGVVVDTAKHHLKSYLVKLPDSKCEHLLYRASKFSWPRSWQLIESWARQLVQVISAVHTRGYVVGTLWCNDHRS